MRVFIIIGCLFFVIKATQTADSNLHVVKEKKSHSDAGKHCSNKGMILVKDTDKYKHDDILQAMKSAGIKSSDIWINGDIKSKSEVKCNDDDILDEYLPWAIANPDGSGNCLQLWAGAGNKWDDTPCSDTKYFICDKISSLRVLTKKKTFGNAQSDCQRRGGNLAKDDSSSKNQQLMDAIAHYPNNDFWFNGKVENGVVSTTDGHIQYCYSNWVPGQPDGSGTRIQFWAAQGHKWDDDHKSTAKMYICEK